MPLDRRQILVAGSAWLAGCRVQGPAASGIDPLFAAHATVLPEVPGAGANHYPMAAEVLETFGRLDALPTAWERAATSHAGITSAPADFVASESQFGRYELFGAWFRQFRAEIEQHGWRAVVAQWAPRLVPGCVAAAWHGLIRVAHAVRALKRLDSPARRDELAHGLAYWAARYLELTPNREPLPTGADLMATLQNLHGDDIPSATDVGFDAVMPAIASARVIPAIGYSSPGDAAAELRTLVHTAAVAFHAMLLQERHRIWLLHAVTGPAAVGLLLPHVDAKAGWSLVQHARQGVVALFSAFGAPFAVESPAARVPEWSAIVGEAVPRQSVHTLKLIEALRRFDDGEGPRLRSVAVQWLAWR